jgi:NADH-ubiquinone oxidoreductase chain 3
MLFVVVIGLLFLFINMILAPHNPYQEKYSIFECGFHSFLGQNRMEFAVKFFIFGLVYLLLDMEIILTYPFSLSEYKNGLYGLIIVIGFIIIITIGFVFELGKNALKIDSKQLIKIAAQATKIKSSIKLSILESKLFNRRFMRMYSSGTGTGAVGNGKNKKIWKW